MRPIDRAAVAFLDGLKVGHTNTPCRHCGRLIKSGEQVTAVARRPRGHCEIRRWEAHLFCADCHDDATTTPLSGVDEFVTTAEVVDGPMNAMALATVTLANIEVTQRSLAYGDGTDAQHSDRQRAAEGL